MRPFSSCVGLNSISMIYAQPFTQRENSYVRGCTHKL